MAKKKAKRIAADEGLYPDQWGIEARVAIGSGKNRIVVRQRFPLGTDKDEMRAWRAQAYATLLKKRPKIGRNTLAADVATHLASGDLSASVKPRRKQQLAWWCAQAAALGAPVLSPEDVLAGKTAKGKTLGECRRSDLQLKRLREILTQAFAPTDPDGDPTEFANTSNHYRTALLFCFTDLDQDDQDATNPMLKVKPRPRQDAEPKGQDARVVVEILLGASRRAIPTASDLRLAALAWVHITPTQLMGVDPARDFHDLPDATREEILDGAITLTKGARLKGRKNRALPPPETIPLNPWGVAAMRALAARPDAHGKFSVSPLNKKFKRGCVVAQAVLASRGVEIDLSAMTLYHLKHSLATTASLASAGLMDRHGRIRQDPGVQRALDHTSGRTTSIYTQAAVNPIVRHVNRLTTLFLEQLFLTPLRGPSALRLVAAPAEA